MTDAATAGPVQEFIARWQGVKASELSTSQSFLIDLCELLGVPRPHPTPEQDYMFERPITFAHGDGSTSAGRVDLYRRGAFVLESKKLKAASHTKGFDDGLLRARSQAEAYARALPATEGRPPFVVVVDVGNRIELYSEFSCSGGTYVPFPDPANHRIALSDLLREDIRQRLHAVWTDPLRLDPSRESARVTREIADRLAQLARSLETSGHPADEVSRFLMRCLFTMFVEDVRLLPEHSFRDLLKRHREQPEVAMRMVQALWKDMDVGGFSPVLATEVLRFNGKLFKDASVLPLDGGQVELLIRAAQADWQHVEPAIFGTLLERALDPAERHKLGAHYTPRAYVERLVLPTVSNRCAVSGAMPRPPPAFWPAKASARRPWPLFWPSITACVRCVCSTQPAAAATSSTSPWNTSSAWKARCSTRWTNWITGRPAWPSAMTAPMRWAARPWTRTTCWASSSTRVRPPLPRWCCGSATCNGTSAPVATCRRPSRWCVISAISKTAMRCWPMTVWNWSTTSTECR